MFSIRISSVIFFALTLGTNAFSMNPSGQVHDLVFEQLASNEGNLFLVPCAQSLLDSRKPYGLNLHAIDLRYDILFKGGYFTEKGHNKEDISVDIRNLRQLQDAFGPKIQEANPYLKYLRVDFAQSVQNKLARMGSSENYGELELAYAELKAIVEKAETSFVKLTQLNFKGMELTRAATKDKILRVLGRNNFPLSGVTLEQLDQVPGLASSK